jgi:hypothetical protein
VSDVPAWITAWERGFQAGAAARAAGRDRFVPEDLEGQPFDHVSVWFVGWADGKDPHRAVPPAVAPAGWALASTLAAARLMRGTRKRRLAGALLAWAALDPNGPAVSRWRGRTPGSRADIPPPRPNGMAMRLGWQWGRLLVHRRPEGPWTRIGMTLPVVFEIERRRRSDLAAWRSYWATRDTGSAG